MPKIDSCKDISPKSGYLLSSNFSAQNDYGPPRWPSGYLEHPPREWYVMGSIPGLDRPKSLKLVVLVFSLGAQGYGNSTTTGSPVSG